MTKEKNHHSGLINMSKIYLAALLISVIAQMAVAQSQPPQQSPSANTAISPTGAASLSASAGTTTASNSKADERYRIGPGDLLEIRFYNRPQLSGTLRVSMTGKIQMPLIEGEIQAACLTEAELAKQIATLFLKYQRNPYVDVQVREYASTPVAVIGAVDKPGRFQLTRRVRLLELLAYAGGPTEKAGGQVVVAHIDGISQCGEPYQEKISNAVEQTQEGFVVYSLKETLRGEEHANPWVQPGDMVSITEADKAYVVGNVVKPQEIPLKEKITVSQAIAMAGGTLPATKSSRIRVHRQVPGATKRLEIVVDLAAIKQERAEDIALQANDIVDVPVSPGKKVLNSIVGALGGGVANLPYVILR